MSEEVNQEPTKGRKMNVASRPRINGLSICSGIGGLELGLTLALGDQLRTVGYVEQEAYAAATIVERMATKVMDSAPIYDDLRTFPSELYSGKVDLVFGGIPCTPFSLAGKKKGTDDDNWLWPAAWEVTRDVGAKAFFLENVPGLRKAGLPDILRDLAKEGWNAEWGLFRADSVAGVYMRRERFFLLAVAGSESERLKAGWLQGYSDVDGGALANPNGERFSGNRLSKNIPERFRWTRPINDGNNLGEREGVADQVEHYGFPPGTKSEDLWRRYEGPQPGVQRSPHRSAEALVRCDRLRVCGNSVVPVVAAHAFTVLRLAFGS